MKIFTDEIYCNDGLDLVQRDPRLGESTGKTRNRWNKADNKFTVEAGERHVGTHHTILFTLEHARKFPHAHIFF